MYQIPLQLDKEGTKERDGEWGKGCGEGRLLLIFPSKGAVIRGTAIIRGNTVFNTMSFTYKRDLKTWSFHVNTVGTAIERNLQKSVMYARKCCFATRFYGD